MSNKSLMVSANMDINSKDIINICRKTEEKNFNGIWFGETTLRDATALCTIASLFTEKIQIGTSIVNVYTRSPGQLAMMGCTINEISGGRFTLGIGVSTPAIVTGWHGINYENPLNRIEEVLKLLKLYFKGEKFEYKGKFFIIKNARLRLKTIPRIAVAALNLKMIRIATRYADRIILNLYPVKLVKEAIKIIEEESAKIGKERPIVSVMLYTYLLDKEDDDYDTIKELIAFYGSSEAYSNLFKRAGFVEEAKGMLNAWKIGNKEQAKKSVSINMIKELIAFENEKNLKEKMKLYYENGIDDVFIAPSPFGKVLQNIDKILSLF